MFYSACLTLEKEERENTVTSSRLRRLTATDGEKTQKENLCADVKKKSTCMSWICEAHRIPLFFFLKKWMFFYCFHKRELQTSSFILFSHPSVSQVSLEFQLSSKIIIIFSKTRSLAAILSSICLKYVVHRRFIFSLNSLILSFLWTYFSQCGVHISLTKSNLTKIGVVVYNHFGIFFIEVFAVAHTGKKIQNNGDARLKIC